MKGSTGRMSVCTTTNFDGMIAVFDPKPSWVRLWTSKHVREMYAVRVDGRVPEDVEAELESPRTEYTERPEGSRPTLQSPILSSFVHVHALSVLSEWHFSPVHIAQSVAHAPSSGASHFRLRRVLSRPVPFGMYTYTSGKVT
ncbi:hypothetical protein EV401DRAFT_2039702 [Pisolithus croceorrhizus]|nr:hypothetical protein EV401DRAFT_2039702 [Pisolithus croceorrhizus]